MHVAVLGFADSARHLAGFVLNELHGGAVVNQLEIAGLFRFGDEQIFDVVGDGKIVVGGLAAGDHVIAVGLGMHGGTGTDRHHALRAIGLGHVEQPIHAALGLAEPLAHERFAATAAARGDPTLHFERLIELDAHLVEHAGAHSARATHAMTVGDVVLFDQNNLGSVFGGVERAAGSGIAGANDQHFGIDGLRNISNGFGLYLPRMLAAFAALGVRAALGRTARGAAAEHAHRGDACGAERCTFEQAATGNTLGFLHNSLLVETLRHIKRIGPTIERIDDPHTT